MNENATGVSGPVSPAELRRKAEERLRTTAAAAVVPRTEADAQALVHELQVHQIELEMQNEELQRARAEAQAALEKYHDLFDFAPVGHFLWDQEGRILELNLAGAALLGRDRGVASGKRFGQFVALEDRGAFAIFLQRVLATDAKETCEVKLLRDGALVSVLVEGIAAQDRPGPQRFCRAAVIDVSPQKRADELAAANRALETEIAARKQVEESLQRAKVAAEAASQAKSRFLANVSHELRTPMNAILGMIDLALPMQVEPAVTDFLKTARESADLLLALLNDLLDSAKIEAGKLELEAAPFSLRSLLERTAQVLAVRASEQGISFPCHVAPEVPDILVGDQIRLRQVILNLAGNGIKFSQRGEVMVSVEPVPTSDATSDVCDLKVSVRDTGIGIPPADLERIFLPFTQADASTTRRFGGTGLGLAICANLVDLMGGRIWAESEAGKGSTFYFTVRLRLAKELPAEFQSCDLLQTVTSHLHILLAEDNPANQKLAVCILKDRGHSIDVADDGQQAVRMARENRYDVILMDVQMPVMDGLEATKAIRAAEDGPRRVPIIAMTAHAMPRDRQRCLAAGMDGYLSKPIDVHTLLAMVENLAAGAAAAPDLVEAAALDSAAAVSPPAAGIFDPELALKRCFDKPKMVADMIQYFFEEADLLFPLMRAALQQGQMAEVGRLGHRLKGTLVCLGASAATAASLGVERLMLQTAERADAEEALQALEGECEVLKRVLSAYRAAAGDKEETSGPLPNADTSYPLPPGDGEGA